MNDPAKDRLLELVDAIEEQELIKAEIKAKFPEEFGRLEELEKLIPARREEFKAALRASGAEGSLEILGHHITVQRKIKTKVDAELLIDKAKERGDIMFLQEKGVLVHSVVEDQILRLDGEARAVYSQFVHAEAMTPAIFLPNRLK